MFRAWSCFVRYVAAPMFPIRGLWMALSVVPAVAETPVVLELHGAFRSTQLEHHTLAAHPGSVALILPRGDGTKIHAFHPQFELPSRYNRYNRFLGPMTVEPETAITRTGSKISGAVHASRSLDYPGTGRMTRYAVNVTVQAERNAQGIWIGSWKDANGVTGTVTGFDDPAPASAPLRFLLHFSASSPSGSADNTNSLCVLVAYNGNTLSSLRVIPGMGRFTSFGNNPPAPRPVASADGRLLIGLSISPNPGVDTEVRSSSGSHAGDAFNLSARFTVHRINSNFARTGSSDHVAELTWTSIGRQAWGTGTLDGKPVACYGHRIDPAQPGMPGPITLPPLPASTLEAIERRLPIAALALIHHPAHTRMMSFTYPSALLQEGGGGKQYDHESFNGYGAVNAFLLAARTLNDPRHLAAAARAGQWLAQRRSPAGLAAYYKTGFWWSPWQGMAFLDLYQATGHTHWLNLAVEYARVVRSKQRPSGTWTYVDPTTGAVGRSFERHDRSGDFHEFNNGEILLFLGRLRSRGVKEFADVEEKATAWHRRAATGGTFHWHSRRNPWPYGDPKIKPGERAVESFPILTYLLYLMKYRDDATPAEVDSLIQFVERHALVNDGPFAPSILGYEPRHAPQDQPAPATFTTAQMAVIDLLRSRQFGNKAAESRAHRMLRAILNAQEPDTGMFDHLGRDLAGHDLGDRGRLSEESHQYLMLRSLTLQLLLEAGDLMRKPAPPGRADS